MYQPVCCVCRIKGRKGAPRGVWEIMDSLKDISPEDLFPGVAYSISEDDGDEDMPYTRPVRPRPKRNADHAHDSSHSREKGSVSSAGQGLSSHPSFPASTSFISGAERGSSSQRRMQCNYFGYVAKSEDRRFLIHK